MSASTIADQPRSDAAGAARVASPAVVCVPLVVALLALAGSLWLSMGMKLKACPFCFYQRTFVMGVVAVLGIGVLTGPRHRVVLNVLALPLVIGGFAVAVFHVYLEVSGKLECPAGILGIGTAPQQSLTVLTLLLVVVAVGLYRSQHFEERHAVAMSAAVVLGLLLAWAAITSSPPMPPAPSRRYTTPLDMCRPPFHAQ
jgi:hypothetical protein